MEQVAHFQIPQLLKKLENQAGLKNMEMYYGRMGNSKPEHIWTIFKGNSANLLKDKWFLIERT